MPKPRDTQPNDRRIWPDQKPAASLRAKLAYLVAGLSEFSKQVSDKVGPLTVDGVHYKPMNHGSLARRLAAAPGYADYAVTFPVGERMRIRATRERVFRDLLLDSTGYPFDWLIDTLPPIIRPGDRVIILGSGTGAFTEAAAHLVGPSGSVTALDPDAISVAYARKRYLFTNVAHERGTHDALQAEPNGAAEVILLTPLAASFPIEQVWRLVSHKGVLVAASHHAPRLRALEPEAEVKEIAINPSNEKPQPGEDRRLGIARRAPAA